MAYRLRATESFEAGFIRIGLRQIERARASVEAAGGAVRSNDTDDGGAPRHDAAVHEARKALKRVRALLRLVRPVLGDDTFKRENARFRDIAALLAGARDSDVLLATLDALSGEASGADARALQPLRVAAEAANAGHDAERDTVDSRQRVRQRGRQRDEAARLLDEAAALWPTLTLEARSTAPLQDLPPGIWEGLTVCYRDGRRRARHLSDRSDDEDVHELRKAVQLHWRHMALLRPAWPLEMTARVELARELSQLLGEDHDLSLVKVFATQHARADSDRVIRLVATKQAALRARALPLCGRLFAEKPGALGKRLARYWQAAMLDERLHDEGMHSEPPDGGARQAAVTGLAHGAPAPHRMRRPAGQRALLSPSPSSGGRGGAGRSRKSPTRRDRREHEDGDDA